MPRVNPARQQRSWHRRDSCSGSQLNRALADGLEYPRRILEALGTQPVRLAAISRRVFPNVPFSMRAMTSMLVLVVLLHLEKTERVRRVEHSRRPAWIRAH